MLLLPSTKNSYIATPDGFERPAVEPPELPEAVLVRHASSRDEARIRHLSRLDDQRIPDGTFIVAELGGQVMAAMSLSAGVVVTEPFRRTADAAELLRLRARRLHAPPAGPVARRRRALGARLRPAG